MRYYIKIKALTNHKIEEKNMKPAKNKLKRIKMTLQSLFENDQ